MKKKQPKKINEIGWAIFSDNKWELKRKPWRIFYDIKLYFLRLKYLKKYGCSEVAFWETGSWFIEVMKEILSHYRYKRTGTPIMIDDFDVDNQEDSIERNEKVFNDYLDKMLDLLEKMHEDYYWDEEKETWDTHQYEKQEEAKNEFIEMFSKIFYKLWE